MSLEWIGVLSTLTASAYAIYAYFDHTQRQVRQAHHITNLEQLKNIPSHTYVAVEGTIESTRALRPLHNSDYWAVLYDLKIKQHVKQWISFESGGGEWVDTILDTRVSRNDVPFYITDSSSTHVYIDHPRQGITSGLLIPITDYIEPSQRSFPLQAYDEIRGLKPIGTQYIESILPTNTRITCVGELSHQPHLTIHPPDSSRPYIISRLSHPQLLASHTTRSKWAWRIVVMMGVLTTTAIGVYIYHKWRSHQQHKKLQRGRAEALARWEEKRQAGQVTYDAEIDTSQPTGLENICVVCLERPRQIVLTNCGHMATCIECNEKINKCPLCREPIGKGSAIRVYT